jgi:hypothetical protein
MITASKDFLILLGALTLSVLFFLIAPQTTPALGFFYTLWALIILARALWMLEILSSSHEPSRFAPAGFLPKAILAAMNFKQHAALSRASADTVRGPVVLWFVLGALYVLWGLYCRFDPAYPYEYAEWFAQALAAFQKWAPAQTLSGFDAGGHRALAQILSTALNGFIFWLMLTCAITLQAKPRMILWMAALFIVSLAAHYILNGPGQAISVAPDFLKGYGWGFWSVSAIVDQNLPQHISPFHLRLVELGWIGVVLLYLPCVVVAFNLIRALSHPHALYALGGLCVMLCLALADYFLVSAPGIQAVWLSGWALVGGLYAIIGKNSLTGPRS